MMPTFSVLMGTLGRPTLKHALDSFARQARVEGDQMIVSIDTYEQGERPDVEALVRSYGDGFLVTSHDAGMHCWGTAQINHAYTTLPITGSHIFTIGDDDVYVDGAFDRLRLICAADPMQPVLFKFLAPWREFLWDEPRMLRGRISGCCIAAPKAFTGCHPTRNAYGEPYPEHDFDWMMDVLRTADRPPRWVDDVLVIARPDPFGDDVMHQGFSVCPHCLLWRFLEHVPEGENQCPLCCESLTVNA